MIAGGRSAELLKSQSNVCGEAAELVEQALHRRRIGIFGLLDICESPVEQMLLVAMWELWKCSVLESRRGMMGELSAGPPGSGVFRVAIEPQKNVFAGDARYRADFFAYLVRPPASAHHWGALIIEVDGHDFHERSKIQAARDRQRDRGMILEGFQVVRFTGSEVFNAPDICAAEVDALLQRRAGETIEYHRSTGRLAELLLGATAVGAGQ